MMSEAVLVCDSCDEVEYGASLTLLLRDGWKRHAVKGRKTRLVVCPECDAEYARRRHARQAVIDASRPI